MSKRDRRKRPAKKKRQQRSPRAPQKGLPRREPDLVRDVVLALDADHPLALLGLASGLLAALEPPRASPFDPAPAVQVPSRDELLRTLGDVELYETSALLAAIAELSGDDVTRARVRRQLASRGHILPPWLAEPGTATVDRTVEVVHVLGDGDNVVLGVRLAGGNEMSVVVYIDHNMGTLVKDAFVVPGPLPELLTMLTEAGADPDMTCHDIDPADARVRIVDAVERGAITFPPFETDTWPTCRPVVEWAARMLPEGGTGYQRPEWNEAAQEQLVERFLVSPFGAGFDDADHRGLLGSLLWFGTDYGPGDPMRWSPVAVEILLTDWLPRKIVADLPYLAKAPALLRAFVRFCHHERGIRAELTAQTLHAIEECEPVYQRTIRSPRPQGPAALLAAMGVPDPENPWASIEDEMPNFSEVLRETLRRAAGVRDEVDEVLGLVERYCDEHLDVEYRTACRRFLARAAAGDPDIFLRGRAETAAAAVCWVVGKANDLFTPAEGGRTVKALMAGFGLTGSPQRAGVLLRAAGFDGPHRGHIDLGSPTT